MPQVYRTFLHVDGCKVESRSVVAELHRFILFMRHSGGTAHEDGGATSQLDLPSLMPLSISGCGRLQLGVPHLVTSVDTESS